MASFIDSCQDSTSQHDEKLTLTLDDGNGRTDTVRTRVLFNCQVP